MKKSFIVLFIIASIGLTSCVGSDNEKECGTPTLFVENIGYVGCKYASTKYGLDTAFSDEDGSVMNELSKISEYTKINKITNKSETYFTYQEWVPSMCGPNVARMTVYENGYLEIYRVHAIGFASYFYFSFDEELAISLNRFVENRIESLIEQEENN